MKKYEPLGVYLRSLPASRQSVTHTFGEVEEIIGSKLPPSAFKRRQFWQNRSEGGTRATHWQEAGFKTGKVDVLNRIVPFHRLSKAELRLGHKPSAAMERELEWALLESYERAKSEAGVIGRRFKQTFK